MDPGALMHLRQALCHPDPAAEHVKLKVSLPHFNYSPTYLLLWCGCVCSHSALRCVSGGQRTAVQYWSSLSTRQGLLTLLHCVKLHELVKNKLKLRLRFHN